MLLLFSKEYVFEFDKISYSLDITKTYSTFIYLEFEHQKNNNDERDDPVRVFVILDCIRWLK